VLTGNVLLLLLLLLLQKIICRYFVLTGTVLRYYRSERDVARSPRGVVDVQVGLGVVDD
jgi:hypothetical protein